MVSGGWPARERPRKGLCFFCRQAAALRLHGTGFKRAKNIFRRQAAQSGSRRSLANSRVPMTRGTAIFEKSGAIGRGSERKQRRVAEDDPDHTHRGRAYGRDSRCVPKSNGAASLKSPDYAEFKMGNECY